MPRADYICAKCRPQPAHAHHQHSHCTSLQERRLPRLPLIPSRTIHPHHHRRVCVCVCVCPRLAACMTFAGKQGSHLGSLVGETRWEQRHLEANAALIPPLSFLTPTCHAPPTPNTTHQAPITKHQTVPSHLGHCHRRKRRHKYQRSGFEKCNSIDCNSTRTPPKQIRSGVGDGATTPKSVAMAFVTGIHALMVVVMV